MKKLSLIFLVLIIFISLPAVAHAQQPTQTQQFKDTDGDGITDDAELKIYKTDPLKWDTDGDGVSDGIELLEHTNPLDPTSVKTINNVSQNLPLLTRNDPLMWYLARITGIGAFILMTGVVWFGLLLSSKSLLKLKFIDSPTALETHRFVALLALVMVIIHFSSLFFDSFLRLSIMEALVPYTLPPGVTSAIGADLRYSISLGIFAFYLMILLYATSLMRKKIIPLKLWRLIHYASFICYILFLVHGYTSGTDSKEVWMQALYGISTVGVLVLLFMRIFSKQLFYPKPKPPKFPMPAKHTARVVSNNFVDKKNIQLVLRLDADQTLDFIPGQFVNLNTGENTFRSYSVASDFRDNKSFFLYVAAAHEGKGSNFTRNLKPDDTVEFIGPSGRFVLPENLSDELIMLATGTGVAPILGMLYRLEAMKYQGNVTMYLGVRNADELFAQATLERFKTTLKHFNYAICMSDPPATWTGNKGRINTFYKIRNTSKAQVFLCGNPYMITDTLKELTARGLKNEQIFHEKFTHAAN